MLPISNSLVPTVSKFFDDDWNTIFDWTNRSINSTFPSVNIIDRPEEFIIELAAPGLNKDYFSIEMKNNALHISYEKSDESDEVEKTYRRREFNYSSFYRTFRINGQLIDGDHIQAAYKDGVLYIELPKKDEVKEKPPRMIRIN